MLSKQPIVVLGMPRSGLSAVSGALSQLGAYFGPESDFEPETSQSKTLTAFCNTCLRYYDLHPATTRPFPVNWRTVPESEVLIGELVRYLELTYEGHEIWGIQQPLACLIWPIFAAAFEALDLKPKIVLVVRHPGEIERSLSRSRQWALFGGFGNSIQRLSGVWLRYTFGALEAGPLTVLCFAKFLQEPSAHLQEIVGKVGGWSPTSGQWDNSRAEIRPGNLYGPRENPRFDFPSILTRVHRSLASAPPDLAALNELSAQFDQWSEMLAPPGLSGTQIGFAWNVGSQVQSVTEPFLPNGDWQKVRLSISAPPRTELHGLLYNRPCRVWIRRSVFRSAEAEVPAALAPGPGSDLFERNGMLLLHGAYEARQIRVVTPPGGGPYQLELELLLETGREIVNDAVKRVTMRYHQSVAGAR